MPGERHLPPANGRRRASHRVAPSEEIMKEVTGGKFFQLRPVGVSPVKAYLSGEM